MMYTTRLQALSLPGKECMLADYISVCDNRTTLALEVKYQRILTRERERWMDRWMDGRDAVNGWRLVGPRDARMARTHTHPPNPPTHPPTQGWHARQPARPPSLVMTVMMMIMVEDVDDAGQVLKCCTSCAGNSVRRPSTVL